MTRVTKANRTDDDTSLLFVGRAGLSDQRNTATIPGIAYRDHWRTTGPDQRSDHGTLRCLLGEELLLAVRPLREEVLSRVQGRAHGYPQTRNCAHQFPGMVKSERPSDH